MPGSFHLRGARGLNNGRPIPAVLNHYLALSDFLGAKQDPQPHQESNSEPSGGACGKGERSREGVMVIAPQGKS